MLADAGEEKEFQVASEDFKDKQPLITVITPCLNAINTIGETLESIRSARKTLMNANWELEHLIVDGGSVDGTAELVAEHVAQHHFCRVTTNISGGPYAAMNVGLQQAKGQYTHILNADDLLLDPEAYANFALQGRTKGATVLISSIGYFRRPSQQLKSLWRVEPIPTNKAEWQRSILDGLHYPHPGFIADTEMYKREGFDESYSLSADYKLMQSILLGPAMPETTMIFRRPLVAMAEGGMTGSWQAVLKGRQQISAINQELGIKDSSMRRYWIKLKQRMRRVSPPIFLRSLEATEP